MSKRAFRDLPLVELRADKDSGSFEGLASCFGKIDSYGTMMAPGCFTGCLPKFIERGFVAGLNHNWDTPIGKPVEARETDKGLYVKGQVDSELEGADNARKLMSKGIVKYMSIGFRIAVRTYLPEEDDVRDWWSEIGYTPDPEDESRCKWGAVRVERIDPLYEFCPVTVPGNWGAAITGSRSEGRPLEGDGLATHIDEFLDCGEEVLGRLEGVRDLRAAKGKSLPPERLVSIRRAEDMVLRLKALLSAPTAGDAEAVARAKAEAELLLLDA